MHAHKHQVEDRRTTTAFTRTTATITLSAMSVVEPSSLGRLVGPHLAKARARDTMLNMLLSESPPESPAVSDDEDDEFEIRPQRQVTIAADVAAPPLSQPAQSAAGQQPAQKPPPHGGDHAPLQRPARIQFRPAPAADGADPGTASVHVFTREEPPQVPEGTSTLTALLQRTSTVANAANKASASAPHVKLRIFNAPPDGRMMALEAPESATLIDVIRMVLAQGGGEEATGPSSAYELLFVDADGDADDDIIPPRAKPFVDFGRDFYLRRASAKKAAAYAQSDPPDDGGGGGGGGGGSGDARFASRSARAERRPARRDARPPAARGLRAAPRPMGHQAALAGRDARRTHGGLPAAARAAAAPPRLRCRAAARHRHDAQAQGGRPATQRRGRARIRLVPRAASTRLPASTRNALGQRRRPSACRWTVMDTGTAVAAATAVTATTRAGRRLRRRRRRQERRQRGGTAAKMQELDLVSGAMLYQMRSSRSTSVAAADARHRPR